MKRGKLFFIPVATICLLCCCGPADAKSYPPMTEALAALASDTTVTVVQRKIFPWLRPLYVFQPAGSTPEKGFIFYPGGSVDPRSYAPEMHRLAEHGFLAVIVPMPFDLAALGSMRASRVIKKFPAINTWAIGGHSLGGVFACMYAASEAAQAVKGLVLWAAYPSSFSSLADSTLKVLSVYGTNDGLTTVDTIENTKKYLPADTIFFSIEGGNHTQFGYYGDGEGLQKGDNRADISRDEQTQRIVDETASFLNNL